MVVSPARLERPHAWFTDRLGLGNGMDREIKCYGSYILPTFLVFGVLVIGVCLWVYYKFR